MIDHNLAFGDWGDDELVRSFWDRHLFRDARPLLADDAFRAVVGPIMDGVAASLPAWRAAAPAEWTEVAAPVLESLVATLSRCRSDDFSMPT